MVILGIFKTLFSSFKTKNHQMNSGMSLFLFYLSDYTYESKMQIKFPPLMSYKTYPKVFDLDQPKH